MESVKIMRGVGLAITVIIISVVMNTTRGGAYNSALETNYSRSSIKCPGDSMATCLASSDDIDLEFSMSFTNNLVSINLAIPRPGDLTKASGNDQKPILDCGRGSGILGCLPQDKNNVKRPEHCFDSTFPPRDCFQQ